MVFFLIVSAPLLQLPVTLSRWVNIGLNAAWPVFITVFAYRLVDIVSLYLQKIADKTENTLDDMLVPLVRKALKTFVIAAGILFILKNMGQDITALIAGLSIGGLALALAAQDTIKNFFGSLMIFVDKPFQVGDWITSGDIDGTVEEVGFRSTRVRTFRNSLVYVPNGVIADRMIDNHGERQYRRYYTKLAVTYDTPPDLIELFVEGLRDLVKNHPKTRKDYYEIHLNDFNNSSIDVMFYIFFDVPSWSEELAARHEIMLSIIRLAETLGINFAFPTQTLHVENFPGKPSLSSEYRSAAELKPAMESFLKGKK
jgi:MscS family membrane protein